MRTLLFIFLLSIYANAQSNEVIGDYVLSAGNEEKHLIEYTLSMNPDGTFNFHLYRNHKNGIPWINHQYSKGTWEMNGKIISFFTDKENDLNEKYTLDFNTSKARFITKSPRDKTDHSITTRLQFFQSKIDWIERLTIFKN